MDNISTGLLIKQLRNEKAMTQKQLAARLHITDKAVSKWERGLCAPDIALLEPLSVALGLTIAELIAGRRVLGSSQAEAATIAAIDYSKEELARKTRIARRKTVIAALACAALAAVLILGAMWYEGLFSIIGRAESPGGNAEITVYSRDITGFLRPRVVTVRRKYLMAAHTQTYPGAEYIGAWYAPDGSSFVMALEYGGVSRLMLCDYGPGGSETDILPALPEAPDGEREISCQFLRWSDNSASVLVYYTVRYLGEAEASGIFWYSCESGQAHAHQKIY